MLDCAKCTIVTRRDKADSLEPELFRPGAERFSKFFVPARFALMTFSVPQAVRVPVP